MSDINLTEEERRLVALYRKVPSRPGLRFLSWAVEVIPAALLLIYGLWADKPVFIIAGFLPLLVYSSHRIYMQAKNAPVFKSVCKKIEEHQLDDE